MVQASPVHNQRALESLKSMSMKKGGGGSFGPSSMGGGGKGDSLKSLRAVVDWWVGGGAPNRKLRFVAIHYPGRLLTTELDISVINHYCTTRKQRRT